MLHNHTYTKTCRNSIPGTVPCLWKEFKSPNPKERAVQLYVYNF